MTGQACTLDHIGIVGAGLAALAGAYAQLGFTVTPAAHHAGGRTGNHCVMLDGGYLELMATLPGGASATLDRFLARHAGAHVLSFGITDPLAAEQRLRRAGFPALTVTTTDRAVDAADPDGPRAAFDLLTPPDPPEGRFHLIRHRTPQALWQPHFLAHPNRARAITGVELRVTDPCATAAWLSRFLGRPAMPDRHAGLAFALRSARLLVRPARAEDAFAAPWVAAVTVTTDDANHALRALLAARGVAYHLEGAAVVVQRDGLFLHFVPGLP